MLKIKVNNKFAFDIEQNKTSTTVNGKEILFDLYNIDTNTVSILYGHKSYLAEVVEMNHADRTCIIKVNGTQYTLVVKDQFDELLHKLGMDRAAGAKVADLKAPMPGMVLKVLVGPGDEVKKGDNLLVLEAMKMENIIKSPSDLRIKSVKVSPGVKVEKNEILIIFE
jgi:biotin carboxyl carrier protein